MKEDLNQYISYLLSLFSNFEALHWKVRLKLLKTAIMTIKRTSNDEIKDQCWDIIENNLQDMNQILAQDLDEFTLMQFLEVFVQISDVLDSSVDRGGEEITIPDDFMEVVKGCSSPHN